MKIYQPMLFVGLGGTGGRIGAELERGLRRELCGPDGTKLAVDDRRKRFQLPDCLQFVYADFSESELDQLPHLQAKGTEAAAYARTSRVVHDLLPAHYDSSPDVARMLRVALHEETRSWLPPKEREPRVAPLHNGAGQLPTVGRSALFATLRGGLEPVLGQLRAAISAISNSAGDLRDVGGRQIRGCDVFVAFSVAGGTGAGIFYDFIHLIGHEFRKSKVPGVKIYPLVVMPSAFPPEAGGGRDAELNASRALVDLSRLVDDQNVPSAQSDFGDVEQQGSLAVRYPGEGLVRLRSSTVQTAFLFSKPSGIRPEDLRRSATAMVMSLIGTELGDDSANGRSEGDYMSFAASFVNKSVERSTPSRSGIGHRGMSTSLAASLTVPVDDLAEIVASRLLAQAVRDMGDRALRADEQGTDRVRDMFDRSGIGRLWTREAPEIPAPDPLPRGTKDIGQALRDRVGDMEDGLARLDRELDREIPRMVEDFKPGTGARELLGLIGPFRSERVLLGLPEHQQRAAAVGFAGMLDNRKNDPEKPDGVTPSAPQIPRIRRSVGGIVPARWGDPDVQLAVEEQERWYQWRANRLWHRTWKDHELRWRAPLARTIKEVSALCRALKAHEEDERKSFRDRRKELYRDDRTGVSYLLPPQGTLGAFYDDVFDRLRQNEGLPENQDAAGLLDKLVQPADWQLALDAVRRSPRDAVKEIKQVVERRVKGLFGEASMLNDRPLLPSLGVLLQAAAGDEDAEASVDARWLEQFRSQLASLLPVGFTPDGNGPLKVLIVYPQSETNERNAQFLQEELNLPRDLVGRPETRAVDTQAITVVLFRSGMSLTDVSEVRHVLRLWAESRDAAGTDDFLHWRQRLGYRDDWLASTEDDRQRILHRILCAMWNGRVEVRGDPRSPEAIRIRLQEGDSATMTLRLEAFDEAVSSWSGLLRAYEQWALLDEGEIIEDFCDQLMAAQPHGLTTTPTSPSKLFRILVQDVAPRQITLLEQLAEEYGNEEAEWMVPLHSFWERTLQGALDLRFPGAQRPTRPNLRALFQRYGVDRTGGPGAGRPTHAPGDRYRREERPAPGGRPEPGGRPDSGERFGPDGRYGPDGRVRVNGYGAADGRYAEERRDGHRPADESAGDEEWVVSDVRPPAGGHRQDGGPWPDEGTGRQPEPGSTPGSSGRGDPEWPDRDAPAGGFAWRDEGADPRSGREPRTDRGTRDDRGPREDWDTRNDRDSRETRDPRDDWGARAGRSSRDDDDFRSDAGTRGDRAASGFRDDDGFRSEPDGAGFRGGGGARGDRGDSGFRGDGGTRADGGFRADGTARADGGFRDTDGFRGDPHDDGFRSAPDGDGFRSGGGARGDRAASGFRGDDGFRGERGAGGVRDDEGLRSDRDASGIRGDDGFRGERGAGGVRDDDGFRSDRDISGFPDVGGYRDDRDERSFRDEGGFRGERRTRDEWDDAGSRGVPGARNGRGEGGRGEPKPGGPDEGGTEPDGDRFRKPSAEQGSEGEQW